MAVTLAPIRAAMYPQRSSRRHIPTREKDPHAPGVGTSLGSSADPSGLDTPRPFSSLNAMAQRQGRLQPSPFLSSFLAKCRWAFLPWIAHTAAPSIYDQASTSSTSVPYGIFTWPAIPASFILFFVMYLLTVCLVLWIQGKPAFQQHRASFCGLSLSIVRRHTAGSIQQFN